MTTSQIKNILSEIGNYKTDMIIPLKEVSSIATSLDQMIYPGSTTRLNFVTKNGMELLLVYNGHEGKNGNFIYDNKKIPNYVISFSAILGFHLKSHIRANEPYKLGLAV